MDKFPVDAPVRQVVAAFIKLDFEIVRQGNHISMIRNNSDGTHTPLTMPNHKLIKGYTLRTILTQAGIRREDFIKVFGE
jgi:hypothetical protein